MSGYSVRSGAGYSLSATFSTSSWEPVRLATTVDVPVLAGGTPSAVDGVNVAVNDRILVRSQAALPTNGIYVVTVVGGGANGTWVRAADASSSNDFVDGKTVGVGQGVTLLDTLWQLTSNAPFTIDVSNVVFIQDANSGWVRDATGIVRLATITDQVGIGTLTPLAGTKYEVVLDDAANNTISDVGVLTHSTTGVAAAGIGAGLRFRAEATAGLTNAGALRSWLTNVGAGTEASEMGLYTRTAGGALTLRWSVKATGGLDPGLDAAYGIGTNLFRVADVVSNAFRVFAAAADVNASYSITNASGLQGGAGGASALDARIYRSALNTWTVDNGAGGAAVLSVLGTYTGTLDNAVNNANSDLVTLTHTVTGGAGVAGIGTGVLFRAEGAAATQDVVGLQAILLNVGAGTEEGVLKVFTRASGAALDSHMRFTGNGNFDYRNLDADVNPQYKFGGNGFMGGAGGATALDTRLYRSALNTWTVDNGAAGSAVFSVLGTTVTQGRVVGTYFAAGNRVIAVTDDFVGLDATLGNRIATLPAITRDGERHTIKNTAALAVVNTVAATPSGANTIDRVAAAVLLTGTQSITVTSDITAPGHWFVS